MMRRSKCTVLNKERKKESALKRQISWLSWTYTGRRRWRKYHENFFSKEETMDASKLRGRVKETTRGVTKDTWNNATFYDVQIKVHSNATYRSFRGHIRYTGRRQVAQISWKLLFERRENPCFKIARTRKGNNTRWNRRHMKQHDVVWCTDQSVLKRQIT